MARKRRTRIEECDNCFGCGQICNVCEDPVNACNCDLDTEERRDCEDCDATGKLMPEVPGYLQNAREMARA
jgi:hypothetical protein